VELPDLILSPPPYSVGESDGSQSLDYLSAQTAFYSLNPDRDIHGPLAINPTYMGLAAKYHSSGHRL
jgi:hypothetical protein